MAPAIVKEVPVADAKESGDSVTTRRKSSEPKQKPRGLAEGIRTLRGAASLCDVLLVVGDEAFPAHQAMLSAMSPAFGVYLREALPERGSPADPNDPAAKDSENASLGPLARVVEAPVPEVAAAPPAAAPEAAAEAPSTEDSYETIARAALMQTEGAGEEKAAVPPAAASGDVPMEAPPSEKKVPVEQHLKLRVRGVSQAESVKIMLDYIYQVGTGCAWEYSPSSLEVNKEVLRLARQFELKHLHEHAARWLTRGLTTKNLVERLVICEEFKLGMLREKLIEQLTANPAELGLVCRSQEVLAHPTILQDLLVQVSALCGIGALAPQSQRSSPLKREAPEETVEEKAAEKVVEEEKPEKVAEKVVDKENKPNEKADKAEKATEKTSSKAEKAPEKNVEEKKAEKGKVDKEAEKVSVKAATKVLPPKVQAPPLKKKRTGV